MVQLLKAWLIENATIFGFGIMMILGGLVAHIKAYEASAIEWTLRQHSAGIIKRMIYGATAGLMVYYLHLEYSWSQPLSFVATGIASIFASDFFDFLWVTAKEWVRRKLGLTNGGGNGNEGK